MKSSVTSPKESLIISFMCFQTIEEILPPKLEANFTPYFVNRWITESLFNHESLQTLRAEYAASCVTVLAVSTIKKLLHVQVIIIQGDHCRKTFSAVSITNTVPEIEELKNMWDVDT